MGGGAHKRVEGEGSHLDFIQIGEIYYLCRVWCPPPPHPASSRYPSGAIHPSTHHHHHPIFIHDFRRSLPLSRPSAFRALRSARGRLRRMIGSRAKVLGPQSISSAPGASENQMSSQMPATQRLPFFAIRLICQSAHPPGRISQPSQCPVPWPARRDPRPVKCANTGEEGRREKQAGRPHCMSA